MIRAGAAGSLPRVSDRVNALFARISLWMAVASPFMLRCALGIVFLWFGILKLFPGLSPAEELAGKTIAVLTAGQIPPAIGVPLLAVWECTIGLGLLLIGTRRIFLAMLLLEMPGTMLPFVFFRSDCCCMRAFGFRRLQSRGAAIPMKAASFACALLLTAGSASAQTSGTQSPIAIPLTVHRIDRLGIYKANINVGIGNLPPVPMAFDTGSIGMHVFGAAKLDSPGSGVQCSNTPVSFTVGNPGKVTYSGVMCSAPLHFQGYATSGSVPIAYLTSAKCATGNQNCRIPNVNNPRAHGGVYGVFGAGIEGNMPVVNPFLTLPPPYGSVFSIRITRTSGEVLLGQGAKAGSVAFPLAPGTRRGEKWQKPQACLFVNGQAISSCLTISFDTGNPVAWIRTANSAAIPQTNGIVTPSTRIGFGPSGSAREATAVLAGDAYGNRIKVQSTTGVPLTNAGIQAYFGHVVTYDNTRGAISVAPSPSTSF